MQLTPIFAELTTPMLIAGGVVAILFIIFLFIGIWASRYTKVGPNQVLIVSGWQTSGD